MVLVLFFAISFALMVGVTWIVFVCENRRADFEFWTHAAMFGGGILAVSACTYFLFLGITDACYDRCAAAAAAAVSNVTTAATTTTIA